MITQQNVIQEINNPKNWKRTHKKSYEIYVCRPVLGTKCSNKLECVDYITDQNKQFILSGTSGEFWVVDAERLAQTYTFADDTPITPETLKHKCDNQGQIDWVKIKTKPNKDNCWAFFLPKSIQNFPVRYYTANKTGVNHGYGDFLVCDDINGQPNLDKIRVVNGEVFPRTYDLHGFPGMFNNNITQANTPRPEISFIKNINRQISNNNSESAAEQAANRMLKIAQGMAQKLGFTSIKLESDDDNYRISIDRRGIDVYAVIDFSGDEVGMGYTAILDLSGDEIAGADINISNSDSVKNSLELIHKAFNKYSR